MSENTLQSSRKYVLRRLTPLECMRLQGYPDGWCDFSMSAPMSDADAAFWEDNRRTRALINGAEYKPITRQRLENWVNGLGTDSAIYKAAGNSLAIPCAVDVIGRIARFVEGESHA